MAYRGLKRYVVVVTCWFVNNAYQEIQFKSAHDTHIYRFLVGILCHDRTFWSHSLILIAAYILT